MSRRLSRSTDARPAAPVRIVHLGVGNFFRAHQAWYTEHAPDAAAWGIAAFTGRSAAVAEQLAPQEGLYTLIVQGQDGDADDVIASLSSVHAADDLAAWRRWFASPELALVTSTITEAGYRRGPGGVNLADPAVAADVAALRADPERGAVTTGPGKLVAGLLARRASDAGPLTLVPCDNVPDNGAMVHEVVASMATAVDPTLRDWLTATVSYATTMVDRITPRVTADVIAALEERTGVHDPACVTTEPFSEWVLTGDFPSGRPDWQATFVDDITPFETRKLWLLNGAHSLLAYAGPILGCQTVAEAVGNPRLRGWVEQWWDEAASHLDLPSGDVTAYRDALLARFENPRLRHRLAQIAADGSQKVPIRLVPVLQADLAAGRVPQGACRGVAAWIAHLRGSGAPVTDAHAREVVGLARGAVPDAVAAVCAWLGVDDASARQAIAAFVREFESERG